MQKSLQPIFSLSFVNLSEVLFNLVLPGADLYMQQDWP